MGITPVVCVRGYTRNFSEQCQPGCKVRLLTDVSRQADLLRPVSRLISRLDGNGYNVGSLATAQHVPKAEPSVSIATVIGLDLSRGVRACANAARNAVKKLRAYRFTRHENPEVNTVLKGG